MTRWWGPASGKAAHELLVEKLIAKLKSAGGKNDFMVAKEWGLWGRIDRLS